ncbi:MAG: ABC-F family ATP-binding cassette domain-containing protein [Candidatus Krumholzibacteriota bacterium]
MALLSIQNAFFDYGREKILRGVNVALQPGVKYALVGANGAGKTTLLAALAGELQLHGGTRQVMGSATIRMLRQETTIDPTASDSGLLLETVAGSAFAREREIEGKLALVAAEIAHAEPTEQAALVEQQGKLQDEFEHLNGYTMKARLETALRGVGLMPETWDRPVNQLSGGERRRAALATVLLRNADLLLLDEPTNHLDLESCEWLEGFLEAYPGAVVLVSHDRHFLDRVARKTLHLDRGRLVSYSGNYSFFDEQSRLRYQQELSAWQRQQTKIRQTEEYIRRNIEGQKTRQAQSRRKQLEKEEKLEKPTTEPGLFRFHLNPVRPSGGTVLETEGLAKGWDGRALMSGLDLHVSRGDRIGIIGPNGCGKSTLLKMMAGRIVPDAGRVVIGHNVDLGFYDQELTGVSDHNTVLSEMMSVDPVPTLGEHRSFLGAFGFGEDLHDRQVSRLSGGERGRLSLLRLIKEGHNTLLLDEPTNHLDIRSRESLEAALAEFTGTMVVVSHDRRFLDKIVHKLIVFSGDGSARVFAGNYADYVWKRKQEQQTTTTVAKPERPAGNGGRKTERAAATPSGVGAAPLSKNEINRRRQKIDRAEEKILELEAAKEAALQEMGSPDLKNDRRLELANRCAEIDMELEIILAEWEKWSLEIEQGATNGPTGNNTE